MERTASRVLIADEDRALRLLLRRLLEKAGHEVQEASRARDLLDIALDHDLDLILLDLKLPGGDAGGVLEEMRAHSSLSRVPVVIMSGEADEETLMRTYRFDVVDFVTKPLNAEVLMAKIGAHTRIAQAYKRSRKLNKEMFMSRIERLETEMNATFEDVSEAERHFRWMQPKAPLLKNYRIDVCYRPYSRLGGDFYDFVWLDHYRLCIVVGDVSGHGIQAAILQAMARKLISLALRQENGDLTRAVKFANFELTNDLPPGSFVAAAMAILDTRTNTIRHVRCGLPYPILRKNEKATVLITPGGPLGLSDNPDWYTQVGQGACGLDRGDSFVLMSDGVVEVYTDDERTTQFGIEGVEWVLNHAESAENPAESIYESAEAETSAEDDVTIISISRIA